MGHELRSRVSGGGLGDACAAERLRWADSGTVGAFNGEGACAINRGSPCLRAVGPAWNGLGDWLDWLPSGGRDLARLGGDCLDASGRHHDASSVLVGPVVALFLRVVGEAELADVGQRGEVEDLGHVDD